jgi:hypothetical protein
MRLARTELQNAFHAGQIEAMKATPGLLGSQWKLSGSHSEPDECNFYAEENRFELGRGVFPVSKIPLKPHPNCLCYMVAVHKPEDEFLTEMAAEVARLRRTAEG